MSEIVKEGWNKYLLQLQAHPLRTKALTSGVLIGSSDIIAQKITGAKRLQFRRILLLMLYGIMYSGPFGHFFHKMMDKIFKGKKGNTTVAKKVVLEQLTSSPWNNMLFMMYYGLVVEGRPWGLVKNKVRHDYPSIQLTAWKVLYNVLAYSWIYQLPVYAYTVPRSFPKLRWLMLVGFTPSKTPTAEAVMWPYCKINEDCRGWCGKAPAYCVNQVCQCFPPRKFAAVVDLKKDSASGEQSIP
ncbi:hypothetical protein RHGRI_003651 [Rhododendron griersonianum]|uniref:Peroxisomal membrane protein PMP22 n=1 Tax=Rhododendron griersonianum TaxID=479676 RepID=A0AAV6L700_9ERIC|nr:hypothetical protein RHGRI_003651 [Rhododendron griersonianum]